MKRFMLLVAGMCVVGVVLSTSVAFAKPLSEQQWREQANAICAQSNQDIGTIGNNVYAGLGPNDQPTAAQNAAFAAQLGPSIRATVASLDALNEPKALKKAVKNVLRVTLKALSTLEAAPVGDISPVFAKSAKLFKRLGLDCG